ncbi:hypothetical protein [Actinotalea ferrariae]|uniref:hypothetical protein n=1 Tax=Actinotalea ferrariae TaxID=1386098 RepID=UPI0021AB152A|nr:hypothetical protein [Actinotalea ferrariae]
MATPPARRPFGIRFTERVLLPFLGPAQVGDTSRGNAASEQDREREATLRTTLERVVGPDGRSYVVERGSEPEA